MEKDREELYVADAGVATLSVKVTDKVKVRRDDHPLRYWHRTLGIWEGKIPQSA